MNIEEFRDFCLSLKGAEESLPFGPNTLVFKVMNKLFCLCDIECFESFNVKCSPEDVIAHRERYNSIHPGYHMNKKHWVTVESNASDVSDAVRKELIKGSYNLILKGLPKKKLEALEKL